MIRRMTVIFTALFIVASLTACTPPLQSKSDDLSDYHTPQGVPSASPVTDPPTNVPPHVEDELVFVSEVIDTSSFAIPAEVAEWEIAPDASYAVVTIRLSKDDWSLLLAQVGASADTDPVQIQLNATAAKSLIDVDQLAEQIIQARTERGGEPIDIRTIDDIYLVTVSGL